MKGKLCRIIEQDELDIVKSCINCCYVGFMQYNDERYNFDYICSKKNGVLPKVTWGFYCEEHSEGK